MQTQISQQYSNTLFGQQADRILRNCVHSGFCTATCPTYQLLGDELDSPRGRIYLIKQMLEGHRATIKTQSHLDRCLTCRSCETTCPSGVEYVHLLDIGRQLVEQQVPRSWLYKLQRFLLRNILPYPQRFRLASRIAMLFNPVLPSHLQLHQAGRTVGSYTAEKKYARSVLMLEGCVQPSMSPAINNATQHILDRLGFSVITVPAVQCCGAISHHLNAHEEAIATFKNNIDAWWPYIEQGCEAIVFNASGCGITLKEYVVYLQHEPAYAERAKKISALCRDISEFINEQNIARLKLAKPMKVSFHAPCTLQHGLKLKDSSEKLLTDLGFELCEVADAHLCCGSAGTYSLLQPGISRQLKQRKLASLLKDSPEYILTANIGCLHHLQSESNIPVRHWVEVISEHIT